MSYLTTRWPGHRSRRTWFNPRREKGAVAIMVALSLVGLAGFAGLALDLGQLYVAKTELQNSADACALAAARELTGASTRQLYLAEAAGEATGTRHDVQFQGRTVTVNSVAFSATLDGSYQAAFEGEGALGLRFARCRVEQTGITPWLMQVLGIGDQTVAAMAVATLSPSQNFSCPIPVGICDSAITTAQPGSWLKGVVGTNDNLTGQFGWVDINPPNGGAKELAKNLTGTCEISDLPATGIKAQEPGIMVSLANDWNSRFGLYHGDVKKPDKPGDPPVPDFTGYAYYPGLDGVPNPPAPGEVINKHPDFYGKRDDGAPYQGNNDPAIQATTPKLRPKGGDNPLTVSEHKTLGGDRRIAIVAVTSGKCPGGPTVASWACVLMLHPINQKGGPDNVMWLEYLGDASAADSPCATSGVPGGSDSIGALVPVLVR